MVNRETHSMMTQRLLTCLFVILAGVASFVFAEEEFIDLTHDLDKRPTFPGNLPFNLSNVFARRASDKVTLISNYIETPEHHGTHMDAPYHFCSQGKYVHEIPIDKLSGPGVVLDFSSQASADPDYNITLQDIRDWETKNGRIPERAIVIMNFGWNQYFGDLNRIFGTSNLSDPSSYHYPGITNEAALFLARDRKINALGGDTPTPDWGQTRDYIVHVTLLCDHEVIIIEHVGNVAALPTTGTRIYIGALKLKDGGGTPARVFAVKGSHACIPCVNMFLILTLNIYLFLFNS